jgi:hypothetical protein
VGVDEAGDHRGSGGVEHVGVSFDQAVDVAEGADGDDAAVLGVERGVAPMNLERVQAGAAQEMSLAGRDLGRVADQEAAGGGGLRHRESRIGNRPGGWEGGADEMSRRIRR